MKNILKRLTAVLCTGIVFSMNIPSAYAEDYSDIMLPSGDTVQKFSIPLDDVNTMNDGDDKSFASAEVGVFRGDDVIYTGYFGETDVENHIPADENSVYEWGSISKTFIWVSAMQLWEQGKLDLNKDVREYLPDDFFQRLSYDEPITMTNLMNHNAGWQETTRPIETTDINKVLPLKEALQEIEPAQINPPNEVMAYSNYGAAVAGYVIECVSGMDYCEYVHENILEPLGMEHTAINPTHSDNEWVREQREKMKSYQCGINFLDLGHCLNYISAYPAGAATGTLSDLMTYAQAFVDDDAPLFENPETQEILFTGTSFYGDSDIPICCHGFWSEEHGVRTYGHSGATSAGQANMIFDLESKIGLVVLVNEPRGNWYIENTSSAVFGSLESDKYSESKSDVKLEGYYLPTRSIYRGMMKFSTYISAISADTIGDISDMGDNVYQSVMQSGSGDYVNVMLFGNKTNSDGEKSLQSVSMEYKHDKFYVLKLCLITLYFLLAAAAFYMIRIRHKMKKFGKWRNYSGSALLLSGQAAQIISVIALFVSFTIFMKYTGIPVTAARITGVIQIVCMAVMILSAVCSVMSMLSKKEKLPMYYYIMQTAGNIISVLAVVYFEMYRFDF